MGELQRVLEAVELLRRRIHKDVPSQHIALLLAVANNPGILMPELCRRLNMPQGTLSRNVKVLSHYVEYKDGALIARGRNLLRTQPDPSGSNCLAVYLTGKGESVVAELLESLYPDRAESDRYERTDYERGYLSDWRAVAH